MYVTNSTRSEEMSGNVEKKRKKVNEKKKKDRKGKKEKKLKSTILKQIFYKIFAKHEMFDLKDNEYLLPSNFQCALQLEYF